MTGWEAGPSPSRALTPGSPWRRGLPQNGAVEDALALLARVARSRGYPADAGTLGALLAYRDALLDARQRVNLTAARTAEDVLRHVVLSALAVVRAVEAPPKLVVDLGTGNGMPGVAAALAWPRARVVLVERRLKKARAVEGILARVGLSNAGVLAADAREVPAARPDLPGAVDLVTVRAVGRLDATTALVASWIAPGGCIAHWKGATLSAAESRTGAAAARRLGFTTPPPLCFEDEAGPRRLVIYRKETA